MALFALATRLVTTVLVVGAVTMGTLPADAAVATAKTSSVAAVAHRPAALSLQGDTQLSNARSRRGANAWKGRKILFTESLPAKWDWSLSTALSKWNTAGGGIRFVRTTKVRKARLNISYGNIGGAAGMASVGRARHAWVKLSSTYNGYDALDAHYRVEVMAVLAHELGHVLGFGHTSTSCSLMSPLMDVDGCGMVPDDRPGYYKCRTIDTPLVARFVRMYGGHARLPGSWCAIEAIPSALTGVSVARGSGSSLNVRWRAPASVASGSRVQIGTWQSPQCGRPPPGSVSGMPPPALASGATTRSSPQARRASACGWSTATEPGRPRPPPPSLSERPFAGPRRPGTAYRQGHLWQTRSRAALRHHHRLARRTLDHRDRRADLSS